VVVEYFGYGDQFVGYKYMRVGCICKGVIGTHEGLVVMVVVSCGGISRCWELSVRG